ncbi:MAG: YggS family pyridoxal phosphate-dependent enzyme [Chloroflexota bacterium]|nr:MAG: YggS family pyridoxal phosphate-dependent enzyme [Chloroflexota bacterium]
MNSRTDEISESVKRILETIPPEVTLVAAAKTRTLEEVEAAIQAGVTHIGYNYIQEALPIIQTIGDRVTWHMIGHLQRNKAKTAVQHFDMIETVDSWRLAETLERHCANINKTVSVLVEINSGRESNKTGVLPDDVDELIHKISTLEHLHVKGLMTMGPRFGNPKDSRPYFQATRAAFERLSSLNLPRVTMQFLSMGMSNTYRIAIEEGANIVRIGTKLFGKRNNP